MTRSALLAGYVADLVLGDPRRLHPVAGFGRMAAAGERIAYAPARVRGAAVGAALVGVVAVGTELLARRIGRPAVLAIVIWTTLGGRSLRSEARAVARLAAAGDDLDAARTRLRSLCGRDAEQLDLHELSSAVVESLAENTGDAVVGTLLWGALAGPAGAAAFRAANTLDAMFGHRNQHYMEFGWAAARLDDLLNWPVARVQALLTCLAAPLVGGSPVSTLAAVRRDAGAHPSPNAGVTEAAFAGALGLSLGGPLAYGGHPELRPRLGDGRAPEPADIERAARLSFAVSTLALLVGAGLTEVRR